MRTAICIARNLAIGAIPLLDVVRGIESHGHECKLIALSQDGSVPQSSYLEATIAQLNDYHWWASLDLQLVFVYSMHFPIDAVEAAKRAGVFVILDCDSDGRISPALWPLDHFRRYYDACHTVVTKARVAKLWLRDVLQSAKFERSYLTLLSTVDLIRIESEGAAHNLVALARFRSLDKLERKIRVVPFCAPVEVCETDLPNTKNKRRILIAGRLNTPQKNPQALAYVIERVCRETPDVEFECFSRGNCSIIKRLEGKYPGRISIKTDGTKEQVRDALHSAKIMLSASKWESLPLIGIEALCMGCTIVAPPIDGYIDLCEQGNFGTLAHSFSKSEIYRAFRTEWDLWESSKRDAHAIAVKARAKYSTSEIARKLLELSPSRAALA